MAGSKFLKVLDYPLLVMLFLMLIGYLEANYPGIFAGLIIYGLANVLTPLTLIPFFGYFIWNSSISYFIEELSHFIPVTALSHNVFILFGLPGIVYCTFTSLLTLAAIYLIIRYWRSRKQVRNSSLSDLIDWIQELKKHIPFKDLSELINRLKELTNNVNKKLIGSVLFWLGIGIASHDFYWECTEWTVDTERPTHGVYSGLGLATTGSLLIESDPRKNLWHYFGLGCCYFAFNLLKILPKGLSRIVAHVFWWSGCGLMSFNWYGHMKNEIIKPSEVDTVMKVLKDATN